MSDVVIGVLLHIAALVIVAGIIWGGFVASRQAEVDYREHMPQPHS